MQDEHFTQPPPLTARRPRTLRMTLLVALIAFLMGAALVGWLAWRGDVDLGLAGIQRPSATGTLTVADRPASLPAPQASVAAAQAALDARLAEMEQRLVRLDAQADAAAGNAARAEALLVAFAARRALEKGAPLGYLEQQLKLRFADAQPNAVRTIVEASYRPVTLDQLVARLEALGPTLGNAPANEGAWSRVQRELGNLFIIRHESSPSPAPQNRLERARILLVSGKTEDAVNEVQRLPGARRAAAWMADARRYASAQLALDLIETTAMLEPRRLVGGDGARVNQPSPLAPPVPTAAASAAPSPAAAAKGK